MSPIAIQAHQAPDRPPAFRILGPLEVSGPAGLLRVDAPRLLTVLAMLLLEADQILPVERLAEAVWDQEPPPTFKSQVQISVSAIRRALAGAGMPGVIVTKPPGYLLQSAPYGLDLRVFDRYAIAAREAHGEQRLTDAATAFRAALAMWRGEPLNGLDSRLVRSASLRLRERMLTVVEECVAVELRLGRHHELIGELMGLVNAHPLREHLSAHLMIALYRSGRQAEALAAYRRTRDDLVEQLGLEPGPELRRLEHAILTGDPDLDRPAAASSFHADAPVPRLLPADMPDFGGRTELVDEVLQLISSISTDTNASTVPVVAVAGPGGVGKTAFALHVAHRLRPRFPDGQLYLQLHSADGQPIRPSHLLERLLRALGTPGSAIPEDTAQRAEAYRNRVAGRRILVVLDDAAEERQVLPLLPGGPTCAVIVTSRFRLTGLPCLRTLDLDVLDVEQALRMLARIVGEARSAAEPESARSLVNLCGRLPLALRICAARLAARPHWPIAQLAYRLSDERRRLDELVHRGLGVRPTIALSYEGLEQSSQLLFCRLGTLETVDFAGWVAAPLLDIDRAAAEDLLDDIVDARLVDAEQRDGAARYRLHDLVRVFARERMVAELAPGERTSALHRLLATWLGLAEQAHRRVYGGDFTVLHGSSPRWSLPQSTVDELLARPLDWLERERTGLVAAVRQAAAAGLDELCWDLAMTCVALFEARSYFGDWRETHEIALAATERAGNRLGTAAMTYSLGALGIVEHRIVEARQQLRSALDGFEELGHVHGRALALRNLAYLERVQGRPEAARVRYQEALRGLRTVGDLVAEAHVLSSLARIELDRQDYPAAERLLAQALEIARSVGGRRTEAQLLHRSGEAQLECGNLDAAGNAFRGALRLIDETEDAIGEAYARYGLGLVDVRRGRHDEAGRSLGRALHLARQCGEQLLTGRVYLALGELYLASHGPDEAATRLTTALELFERLGATGWQRRTLALLTSMRGAGRP